MHPEDLFEVDLVQDELGAEVVLELVFGRCIRDVVAKYTRVKT